MGWVFSATVRWPFDGAQDERTGGLGVDWLTLSGGFWVQAQGRNDVRWFDGLSMNGAFR